MIVVLYLYFHIHGKFSGMKELMMNHKTWSRQAEKRKSKAEYVLQLSNKAAQHAAYFITYQTINIKFINLLGTNKNIPQGISAPNQRSNASMRWVRIGLIQVEHFHTYTPISITILY